MRVLRRPRLLLVGVVLLLGALLLPPFRAPSMLRVGLLLMLKWVEFAPSRFTV